MFITVLYFIPSIICLIWFILLLFRKRNRQQKILTWLIGFSTLHYISTATFVAPMTDFKWVCTLDIICQPLVLCIIALAIIYIRSHLQEKMSAAKLFLFLLPAIIQGTVIWLLYFMIGFYNVVKFIHISTEIGGDLHLHGHKLFEALPPEFNTQLYRIFHFFDVGVSNIWCAILAFCLLISCYQVVIKYGYKFGDGLRFWLNKNYTTTERAISYFMLFIVVGELPFIMLGRKYIFHHPLLGCMMAILVSIGVFFMCYFEYINHAGKFNLYIFTHLDLFIHGSAESGISAQVDINTPAKLSPTISARTEEKNNNIAHELQRLLEKEKIFTDKNLTLEILAKRMNTNRNKLSTIVNHVYGMDFRNVLAQFRIEEAKRFMKSNPSATSDTVATHCGFKDASTFFHRFKDIVGESPRMWLSKK